MVLFEHAESAAVSQANPLLEMLQPQIREFSKSQMHLAIWQHLAEALRRLFDRAANSLRIWNNAQHLKGDAWCLSAVVVWKLSGD